MQAFPLTEGVHRLVPVCLPIGSDVFGHTLVIVISISPRMRSTIDLMGLTAEPWVFFWI